MPFDPQTPESPSYRDRRDLSSLLSGNGWALRNAHAQAYISTKHTHTHTRSIQLFLDIRWTAISRFANLCFFCSDIVIHAPSLHHPYTSANLFLALNSSLIDSFLPVVMYFLLKWGQDISKGLFSRWPKGYSYVTDTNHDVLLAIIWLQMNEVMRDKYNKVIW